MTQPIEQYVEDAPQVYEGAAEPMQPIPVQNMSERRPPDLTSCMTWAIPTIAGGQPVQILQRTLKRFKAKIIATPGAGAPASIAQPAVPASGVAQYNNNNQTVAVTVTGGTVSAITVNGVSTGATSGTFFVPANGNIAVTYTVAPTWTWAGTQATNGGLIFSQALQNVQGANPQGFTITSPGTPVFLPDWESQQPLYAIGFGAPGTISVWDERFL